MDAKRKRAVGRLISGLVLGLVLSVGCSTSGFRSDEEILAWEKLAAAEIHAALDQLELRSRAYVHAKTRQERGDPAVSQQDVDTAQATVDAAHERVQRVTDNVGQVLRAYLERHPDANDVRNRLGGFLADQWKLKEAEAAWLELIRRAPDYADAYNNLGTIYSHMGRDMEAVDLFRKAIALKPDEPEYVSNLGVLYMTHRRQVAEKFGWDLPRVFREGLAAYERARDLAPEDPHYAQQYASAFIMAKYFDVTGTTDEAVAAWKRYLTLDLLPSERVYGLNSLGLVLIKEKGDKAQARPLLEESLKLRYTPTAVDLLKECEEQHGPEQSQPPQSRP